MSKVLLVGNVTKDVYLNLDDRQNRFEVDEKGVSWMDLGFDGGSHRYFRRTAVHGGAAVSREVLEKLGIGVEGGKIDNETTASAYRYILCRDDEVTYFSPNEWGDTVWMAPDRAVDWIYIDRSAAVTEALSKEVLAYLNLSTGTKLAIYIGKKSKIPNELISRAEMILVDEEVELANTGLRIGREFIESTDLRARWSIGDKTELMTDLTTRSIISATLVAGRILGMSEGESMKMAVANVENATLNETVELNRLRELMMDVEINERRGPNMADGESLRDIAKKMVSKGILAADESGGSIHKKFEGMGIVDDEQHRRDYRNIFFTTPELSRYASGVILFDETARQNADSGQNFVEFLRGQGLIVGVAAGQGYEDWPEGGKITFGLEDLAERLKEYYEMGVRFMKWRAPFEVGKIPESLVVEACRRLTEYAKECQKAGLVPIVEPEVVHDGSFSIEECAEATSRILHELFSKLKFAGVDFGGCVLKVNMVLAGNKYVGGESDPEEVGKWTARVLRECVPEGLAGVVFLSGGQGVEQSTDNLGAIVRNGPFPWPVTFSFARALQGPALEAWGGNNVNNETARRAFAERLKLNFEATNGLAKLNKNLF